MMEFKKITKKEYGKFLTAKCTGLLEEAGITKKEALDYFSTQLELPARKSAFSAGYDFQLPLDLTIKAGTRVLIPTGIKVKLDPDKYLGIHVRSSFGIKKGLVMANTTGIIDCDYFNNPDNEGHILICLLNTSQNDAVLKRGESFCQGIISSYFVTGKDAYGKGETRTGGIGSTDKKTK